MEKEGVAKKRCFQVVSRTTERRFPPPQVRVRLPEQLLLQSVEEAEVVGVSLPHQLGFGVSMCSLFEDVFSGGVGDTYHSFPYSVPEYLYPRSRQLRAHFSGVCEEEVPLDFGRAREGLLST